MMKPKKLQSALLALALWLSVAGAAMAQTKVVGYVPNWIDINSFANTLDYSKVTHLNIAFENANSSGNLSFNTAENNLITKAHANHVKVLVSIGGGSASEDATQRNIYFNLISSSKRAAFIQKLTAYVTAHNLDGLDIDLEGPAINADYGNFIRDLANALHPMGKIITAAVSEGYGGANIATATLPYFDFVNIMAYDATGPWDPDTPGQHSSYAYAQSAISYWQGRGLTAAQTILGLPFYGYGFGAAFRDDEYPYSEIVNTYPGAENQDQVGNTIWYNGIPTIKAKTTLALQKGAGVMIWQLASDATGAKSLLLAINQVIKGSGTDTQAPTAPANLRATTTTTTSVALAWNASTDNVAVTSYEVFKGAVSAGTTTSTAFTVTGLTANTSYSFTVKAKDAAGNVSAASTALTVKTGTAATNLALNKTATSSSIEAAGLEASRAVDGNATTTRWASVEGVDPQWLAVDLGASYTISSVKITWEAAYASAYAIEISANGSTWTNLKSITGNTALVNNHTGLSGTGRYLRIYGTARGTAWGYSIYELEVYGAAAAQAVSTAALTEAGISVYPSPAEDHVTIQLPEGWSSGASVNVVSDTGKPYLSQVITEKESTLQLSSLPQGQYLIQIVYGQSKTVKRIWKK